MCKHQFQKLWVILLTVCVAITLFPMSELTVYATNDIIRMDWIDLPFSTHRTYDVKGINLEGTDVSTTYENCGYQTVLMIGENSTYEDSHNVSLTSNAATEISGTGITVQAKGRFIGENKYLNVTYVLKNTTASEISHVSLGIYSDTSIGNDDQATIKRTGPTGLLMVNGFSSIDDDPGYGLQYSLQCPDATTMWFGPYKDDDNLTYDNYVFDNTEIDSFENDDSAIGFSWQGMTIPANSEITCSAIFGINTITAPPVFSSNPIEITLNRSGNTTNVDVKATVTDTEGLTNRLYCMINDDTEFLMRKITATGQPQTITETLLGTNFTTNGIYKLSFFVMNDAGAMSDYVNKYINIKNNESVEVYAVTIPQSLKKVVTSNKTFAEENEIVTLTVTPVAGYHLDDGGLKCNDGAVALTPTGIPNQYKFTMPKNPVTVAATFSENDSYSIITASIAKGTVTAATTAPAGSAVTISITGNSGYTLIPDSVKCNDGAVTLTPTGVPNQYKFTMPERDAIITANFRNIAFSSAVDNLTPSSTKDEVKAVFEQYSELSIDDKKMIEDKDIVKLSEMAIPHLSITSETKTSEDVSATVFGLPLIARFDDITSDEQISISLNIESKKADDIEIASDILAISQIVGEQVVGGYFYNRLSYKLNDAEPELLQDTSGSMVTTQLNIPNNIRGGSNYRIACIYNDAVEILPDLDANNDTITFKTDKFSTYAILYTPALTPAPTPTPPIPHVFILTFDSQGGSVINPMYNISIGSIGVGSHSIPVNAGYTFGGWYTKPNGEGTQYTNSTPLFTDLTVYAKWNLPIATKGNSSFAFSITSIPRKAIVGTEMVARLTAGRQTFNKDEVKVVNKNIKFSVDAQNCKVSVGKMNEVSGTPITIQFDKTTTAVITLTLEYDGQTYTKVLTRKVKKA